jgi:PhzF family phenazine biosynthesis protein
MSREIPIYQIDAFAEGDFRGNPAAVCPLERWLPDTLLQMIAEENNLSETAFYVPEGEGFRIRWFTPTVEVDLCGHATLAAARVVFDRGAVSLAPSTKNWDSLPMSIDPTCEVKHSASNAELYWTLSATKSPSATSVVYPSRWSSLMAWPSSTSPEIMARARRVST